MSPLETILDQFLMQIALVVIAAVFALVGRVAATAIAAIGRSRAVKALREFDAGIYDQAVLLLADTRERIADEYDPLGDGDQVEHVRGELLKYINEAKARTGIKKEYSDEDLESFIRAALQAFRSGYSADPRPRLTT